MQTNQIVYCTYHQCYVRIIDLNEGSPSKQILCQFQDNRTQSIPAHWLEEIDKTIESELNANACNDDDLWNQAKENNHG